MDQVDASNALMQLFLTEFFGEFPIALPNQIFSRVDPTTGSKWARISMHYSAGGQESLGASGNRRFQYLGDFVVQVFTAAGDASNTNDVLCTRVIKLMSNNRVNADLWTGDGRVFTVGEGLDWYQQNVIVPFTFSDIR